MNRVLLTVALSLAPALLGQGAERIEIYDARFEHKETRITPAEQAVMRREVFPAAARHWQISYSSNGTERVVHRPRVIDAAHGSFTRPGAKQTAVLYLFNDYADGEALDGLVILEKNEVVAHAVYDGFWDWGLEALPDINKNGRTELMMITGQNLKGVNDDWITMLEFTKDGLRTMGSIPVYHDDAGTNYQTKSFRSYKVEAEPGAKISFFRQSFNYEGDRQNGKWIESGSLKPMIPQKDTVEYELLDVPPRK